MIEKYAIVKLLIPFLLIAHHLMRVNLFESLWIVWQVTYI